MRWQIRSRDEVEQYEFQSRWPRNQTMQSKPSSKSLIVILNIDNLDNHFQIIGFSMTLQQGESSQIIPGKNNKQLQHCHQIMYRFSQQLNFWSSSNYFFRSMTIMWHWLVFAATKIKQSHKNDIPAAMQNIKNVTHLNNPRGNILFIILQQWQKAWGLPVQIPHWGIHFRRILLKVVMLCVMEWR